MFAERRKKSNLFNIRLTFCKVLGDKIKIFNTAPEILRSKKSIAWWSYQDYHSLSTREIDFGNLLWFYLFQPNGRNHLIVICWRGGKRWNLMQWIVRSNSLRNWCHSVLSFLVPLFLWESYGIFFSQNLRSHCLFHFSKY